MIDLRRVPTSLCKCRPPSLLLASPGRQDIYSGASEPSTRRKAHLAKVLQPMQEAKMKIRNLSLHSVLSKPLEIKIIVADFG